MANFEKYLNEGRYRRSKRLDADRLRRLAEEIREVDKLIANDSILSDVHHLVDSTVRYGLIPEGLEELANALDRDEK